MGEVKRYYVGDNGLVEGEQLGRLGVYLAADYDALLGEAYLHEVRLADASEVIELLRTELAALKAKAAVPDGWKLVKVGVEGVRFGNAWHSHEKITGYSADQLNAGHCGIAGRAYMEWLAASQAQPQSDGVIVPRELLERVAEPVLFTSQEDSHYDACTELRVMLGGEA